MASFGSTGGAQPQKSLFGAPASSTQAPQTGGLGLFGAPAASSQPQTGGLFGQANTTSQAAPQTAGLFGQAATSAPQSAGLFGQSATSAPQAAQAGSLFGAAANTQAQQPQNTTAAATGMLGQTSLFGNAGPSQAPSFGSALGQNQPQGQQQVQGQQQAGGLFSGLGAQTQAPSSLFNNASTAQKPLFGAAPATQPSGLSLFGGSQAQSGAQPGFGSSIAGQAGSTATNTVPGVTIDLSNLRSSTRFSDLHDSLKNEIIQMEQFIQQQLQYHSQINAFMPGLNEQISSITPDVDLLSSRLEAVETSLDNDASDIHNVKMSIKRDADEAKLSFMAVEQLKLPAQFHYSGVPGFGVSLPITSLADPEISSPVDMASYFESKQAGLSEAISQHQKYLEEIESHLYTVEASTVQKAKDFAELRDRGSSGLGEGPARRDGLRDLGMTFQAFETAILNLATKVGETREGLTSVTLGSRSGL